MTRHDATRKTSCRPSDHRTGRRSAATGGTAGNEVAGARGATRLRPA
ncbi:hypothetical protein ACGFS9_16880 [Streptomyces sp. NPDC048566]